ADGWRLEYRRQQTFVDVRRRQHLLRPAALRDVEHERPRCIGDVDRVLAAQAKTDVVLGQQQVAHAAPHVRLVRAYPEQLGQREVGERGIRRAREQTLATDVL